MYKMCVCLCMCMCHACMCVCVCVCLSTEEQDESKYTVSKVRLHPLTDAVARKLLTEHSHLLLILTFPVQPVITITTYICRSHKLEFLSRHRKEARSAMHGSGPWNSIHVCVVFVSCEATCDLLQPKYIHTTTNLYITFNMVHRVAIVTLFSHVK